MFKKFCEYFGAPDINTMNMVRTDAIGFNELLGVYAGKSFGKGLYRLHILDEIEKWNSIITKAYPEYSNRVTCFGYDWLGRQFAVDKERVVDGQSQILMFEPGTSEVLEIPCDFYSFHEEEIVNYNDACLASGFFKEWLNIHPNPLENAECVGYKIPLFLGGEDVVTNLELCNMDVYWEMCSQLIQKTKLLPEGTTVRNIVMK